MTAPEVTRCSRPTVPPSRGSRPATPGAADTARRAAPARRPTARGLRRRRRKAGLRDVPDAHGRPALAQDAYAALRAGTLSADRGPTSREAADDWLAAARAGIVRNRSGDPYKPRRDPRLRAEPGPRVLPGSGTSACGDHAAAAAAVRRPARRRRARGRHDHAAITPLRAIYRRARQLGEVHANPTPGVSVPAINRRQTRFATAEQIEAMLARLDGAQDRALWATALYAGLRRGELTALHREDVDLATGVIRVERGWDDERGRDRAEVQAGPPQGADPRRAARPPRRVPDRRAASGRIFIGVRDSYDRGRAAAEAAGVEPPTLHECRHGYAVADDRGRRQRQGALDVHGPREHPDHARPVRALLPGAEDEAAGLLDAFLARQVGGADEAAATAVTTPA